MRIQKQFTTFLKKEGVLERYMHNWNPIQRPIKSRMSYILKAFNIDDTEEGFYFWHRLDKKWKRKLYCMSMKDPSKYKIRCSDCGQFVKKELWIKKDLGVTLICHNCGGF